MHFVFLQTHVWSANLGSCGLSLDARAAEGPAFRTLLSLRAVAPEHPGKWPLLCWEASPFVHCWYTAPHLSGMEAETPVSGRHLITDL